MRRSPEPGAGQRGIDWADAFELLISHGHAHEQILGYTLRQFRAYLERACRREQRAWRMQVLAARLALADGDTLKRALDTIKGG